MILLIDNYDSFVFNLARYFERLGQETAVVRNDEIDVAGVRRLGPDAVVISPGPCTPDKAGCSLHVVSEFGSSIPLLGICLGHQAIAQAFGGKVVRSGNPMHGRTSQIDHDGTGIFAGLANPLIACRYHSLIVDAQSLPDSVCANAWAPDGTIMAIRHHHRPIVGLQFHPESILTSDGYSLLAAFLKLAGLEPPSQIPQMHTELKSEFLR